MWWDSKIFFKILRFSREWGGTPRFPLKRFKCAWGGTPRPSVGITRYIASEVGLQDLLCGLRSQTLNAAWSGTPRSLLSCITCNYAKREWVGTPRSPLGRNRHNRAWGGTPRPPLWYPRYKWSEVGLQVLHCGNPFLSYVRWDSKTVAETLLFSIMREVRLWDRRWTQLFHSKTDREKLAESFTWNLFQPYLTMASHGDNNYPSCWTVVYSFFVLYAIQRYPY